MVLPPMKIVHAASELYPLIKTGGLADAVGGLTRALAAAGHDVTVFLPGYRAALEHPDAAKAERVLRLQVELGGQSVRGDVWRVALAPRLTLCLIARDEYFDRRFPYGPGDRDYDDNAERFVFFAQAVAEAVRLADLKANVVHAHDWQAALLPLYLRLQERRHGTMLAEKTVLTVHNLAFQGVFPMEAFPLTNLPDEFRGVDGLEFFGQINLLKGGLLFADRVTTVSPTYAREIQTPDFGCGLEGVVATRAADLVGLVNGIDDTVWNPATDPLLPARYTAAALEGKAACRRELLRRCGFDPQFAGPVYGLVGRLTEQKGIGLLLAARRFFERENCRLVVLGSGRNHYEEALAAFAREHHKRVVLASVLDEPMAHLIEAGSDFFLMPSTFEPCGLNQMYSQRYGTPPICSRVGGLLDTVIDLDAFPELGTGLLFEPTEAGFVAALKRSQALHADREKMTDTIRRGMARDFGWAGAAHRYELLYRDEI